MSHHFPTAERVYKISCLRQNFPKSRSSCIWRSSIVLSAKLALTLSSVITFRFSLLQWGELYGVDLPLSHHLWLLHHAKPIFGLPWHPVHREGFLFFGSLSYLWSYKLLLLIPMWLQLPCKLRTSRLKQHMHNCLMSIRQLSAWYVLLIGAIIGVMFQSHII